MKRFNAAANSIGTTSQFLQRLQGSVLISPLLITAVVCWFLTANAQIAELLIYIVEPENPNCATHLGGGFIAISLLAVVVFFGYLSGCVVLRKAGIGYGSSLFYKETIELQRDRSIVLLRNAFAILCAFAPLAAIAYIFQIASRYASLRQTALGDASIHADSLWPRQFCAPDAAMLSQHLSQIGYAWLGLSAVVVSAILLIAHLTLFRRHGTLHAAWRPTRTRRSKGLALLALVVLLAPIPLMLAAPQTHDAVYRWLGPLTTLGLVMMATAWLLFFIAEGSKRSGIPFFLLVFIAVFGIGLSKWASTVTTEQITSALQPDSSITQAGNTARSEFAGVFESWLNARKPAGSKRPYPVYIVASPGGGIYAAAYVTSLMARLEEACPGFSEHVFAISAVSGGAIGSTLVNAAMRGKLRKSAVTCANEAPTDLRTESLKSVMATDHLSPTLATTVPDILIKLLQIGFYEAQTWTGLLPDAPKMKGGRAEALELSFSEAWNRSAAATRTNCSQLCNPLEETSANYWTPNSDAAPALILNTTWAETGDRIAYAPFSLKSIGDGSLSSMSDLDDQSASLIEAAVASARFPAVLPAKILNPKDKRKLWWNFVDGGYADASGTTTALEVYNAIKHVAENNPDIDIDLKLLVITQTGSDQRARSQSGSGLVHAISPITTLLTIREQISRRAVLRAVKDLVEKPPGPSVDQSGCWQVVRIVANPRELNLPLGWLLARNTVEAIDHTLLTNNKDVLEAIKQNVAGNSPCPSVSNSEQPGMAATK